MITVLIATYNGAITLPDVLTAYHNLKTPDEEWKLVIVDNGSSDPTKEIITSFIHLLPITYLFEPRRGKNIALNTGLSSIVGDLIVFTDDDVIPHPDWLRQLRLAADSQPLYSIFGGPVLPLWESLPDDWILLWMPLGPTFSILDSKEEGPIEVHYVYGNNMAIRSRVFQAGYKFDETIGPKGSNYAMGSETELLMRLHKSGFKAWHCSSAIVHHMIRSFQMDQKWVLSKAIRFGRGMYRLGNEFPNWTSFFFGIPRYWYRRIFHQIVRVGKAKWSGDAERIFGERWRLNYLLGIALEARHIYKSREKSTFPHRVCKR